MRSPGGPPPETEAAMERLRDRCVGENLDQLTLMDLRGDGVARLLYAAARRLSGGPLALAAAAALDRALTGGGRALLLTGFIVPPWGVPETDGLPGAVVLGRALEVAFQAQPVVVCEPEALGPLRAGFQAAGLHVRDGLATARAVPHSAVLLPFPKERRLAAEAAARLADNIDPAACVAIERPGPNRHGEYHFALGRNVSEWIAPVDLLYEQVARAGVLTVGIGDFGNELGLGAIADAVRAETPAGATCECPCGGGTACPVGADVTVACSVSDWGAYGTAAALAYLKRDPSIMVDARTYRRLLDAVVAAGAVDGASAYLVRRVDGAGEDYNACLVDLMREVALRPLASGGHDPIRRFRAEREQSLSAREAAGGEGELPRQ